MSGCTVFPVRRPATFWSPGGWLRLLLAPRPGGPKPPTPPPPTIPHPKPEEPPPPLGANLPPRAALPLPGLQGELNKEDRPPKANWIEGGRRKKEEGGGT